MTDAVRVSEFKGLTNVLDFAGAQWLSEATNVYLDNAGKVRSLPSPNVVTSMATGYVAIVVLNDTVLAVSDTDIAMTSPWTANLYTFSRQGGPVSVAYVPDGAVVANGHDYVLVTDGGNIHRLVHGASPSPAVKDTNGLLPAGRYLVQVVPLLDIDGVSVESIATEPVAVDVVSGGILVEPTLLPAAVYVSDVNGSQPYYHGVATLPQYVVQTPPSTDATPIFDTGMLGIGITDLAYDNGEVVAAIDGVAIRSAPFAYHVFDPATAIELDGAVSTVGKIGHIVVMSDGIRTYADINDELVVVADSPMVRGTAVIDDKTSPSRRLLFTAPTGIHFVSESGEHGNVTGSYMTFPTAASGSACLANMGGTWQYIVTLSGTDYVYSYSPNNGTRVYR